MINSIMTSIFSSHSSSRRSLTLPTVGLAFVLLCCASAPLQPAAATGVLYVDWWGAADGASDADVSLLRLSLASAALVANSRVRTLQAPSREAPFFAFEIVDAPSVGCATSATAQRALVGATVGLQDGSRSVVVRDLALAAPRSVVRVHTTTEQVVALFASAPSLIAVVVVLFVLGAVGVFAVVSYCVRGRCVQRCEQVLGCVPNPDAEAADNDDDDDYVDDDDARFDCDDARAADYDDEGASSNPARGARRASGASFHHHHNHYNDGTSTPSHAARGGGGPPPPPAHPLKSQWWRNEVPPVLLQRDDAGVLGRVDRLAAATGLSARGTRRLSEHLAKAQAEQRSSSPLAAFVLCSRRELVHLLDLDRDDARALDQMLALAAACHSWMLVPPSAGCSDDDGEDDDGADDTDDGTGGGDDDDDANSKRGPSAAVRRRNELQKLQFVHRFRERKRNRKEFVCCLGCA